MLVIRHDIRVKRELERLSRKAERRPCGFVTRGDHPLRSKFRRFLRLINKRSKSVPRIHGPFLSFLRVANFSENVADAFHELALTRCMWKLRSLSLPFLTRGCIFSVSFSFVDHRRSISQLTTGTPIISRLA